MKSRTGHVFPLVFVGMATSCGYSAPYQTSGPVLSPEGVQITLAGERCYVNRTAEQYPTTVNDDALHVDVNLQVKNASNQVAMLSLAGFQLVEDAKTNAVAMHPRESGSLTLLPGETRAVSLDFEGRTESDCHRGLALATQDAIAIEGKPIHLASIYFVATR